METYEERLKKHYEEIAILKQELSILRLKLNGSNNLNEVILLRNQAEKVAHVLIEKSLEVAELMYKIAS